MPFFDVRLRVGTEWFEDVVEAETSTNAGVVLEDRLRARFAAGIEEIHVTRMPDMQTEQSPTSKETPK